MLILPLTKMSVRLAWQFLIQLGAEKIYIYTEDCRPRQLNFLHIKIGGVGSGQTGGPQVGRKWRRHVGWSSHVATVYEYWLLDRDGNMKVVIAGIPKRARHVLVPLIVVGLPQSSGHKSLLTDCVGLDFIILKTCSMSLKLGLNGR